MSRREGARGVRGSWEAGHDGRVGVSVGVGGTGHVAGVLSGHVVIVSGGGGSAGPSSPYTDLLTS